MNHTVFRQISDIQIQAQKHMAGNSSIEELESFARYNEEMKSYLLDKIDNIEICSVVKTIPDVLKVEVGGKSLPLVILIAIGLITFGMSALYLSYIANMRRNRLIQQNIQFAQGQYSKIEYLLKLSM